MIKAKIFTTEIAEIAEYLISVLSAPSAVRFIIALPMALFVKVLL